MSDQSQCGDERKKVKEGSSASSTTISVSYKVWLTDECTLFSDKIWLNCFGSLITY